MNLASGTETVSTALHLYVRCKRYNTTISLFIHHNSHSNDILCTLETNSSPSPPARLPYHSNFYLPRQHKCSNTDACTFKPTPLSDGLPDCNTISKTAKSGNTVIQYKCSKRLLINHGVFTGVVGAILDVHTLLLTLSTTGQHLNNEMKYGAH